MSSSAHFTELLGLHSGPLAFAVFYAAFVSSHPIPGKSALSLPGHKDLCPTPHGPLSPFGPAHQSPLGGGLFPGQDAAAKQLGCWREGGASARATRTFSSL